MTPPASPWDHVLAQPVDNTSVMVAKTGRTVVVAGQVPLSTLHADVTDAATLLGTCTPARTPPGLQRGWLWICS